MGLLKFFSGPFYVGKCVIPKPIFLLVIGFRPQLLSLLQVNTFITVGSREIMVGEL